MLYGVVSSIARPVRTALRWGAWRRPARRGADDVNQVMEDVVADARLYVFLHFVVFDDEDGGIAMGAPVVPSAEGALAGGDVDQPPNVPPPAAIAALELADRLAGEFGPLSGMPSPPHASHRSTAAGDAASSRGSACQFVTAATAPLAFSTVLNFFDVKEPAVDVVRDGTDGHSTQCRAAMANSGYAAHTPNSSGELTRGVLPPQQAPCTYGDRFADASLLSSVVRCRSGPSLNDEIGGMVHRRSEMVVDVRVPQSRPSSSDDAAASSSLGGVPSCPRQRDGGRLIASSSPSLSHDAVGSWNWFCTLPWWVAMIEGIAANGRIGLPHARHVDAADATSCKLTESGLTNSGAKLEAALHRHCVLVVPKSRMAGGSFLRRVYDDLVFCSRHVDIRVTKDADSTSRLQRFAVECIPLSIVAVRGGRPRAPYARPLLLRGPADGAAFSSLRASPAAEPIPATMEIASATSVAPSLVQLAPPAAVSSPADVDDDNSVLPSTAASLLSEGDRHAIDVSHDDDASFIPTTYENVLRPRVWAKLQAWQRNPGKRASTSNGHVAVCVSDGVGTVDAAESAMDSDLGTGPTVNARSAHGHHGDAGSTSSESAWATFEATSTVCNAQLWYLRYSVVPTNATLRILHTIVKNLAQVTTKHHVRRLNVVTPRFFQEVARYGAAMTFLRRCGFVTWQAVDGVLEITADNCAFLAALHKRTIAAIDGLLRS